MFHSTTNVPHPWFLSHLMALPTHCITDCHVVILLMTHGLMCTWFRRRYKVHYYFQFTISFLGYQLYFSEIRRLIQLFLLVSYNNLEMQQSLSREAFKFKIISVEQSKEIFKSGAHIQMKWIKKFFLEKLGPKRL